MSFFFFISHILVGFSFIHISLFSFLSRVHPGGKLQFEREIRWVASKCVRVSQVYQKKNKHINEHVCLMYSPYQWIYKHHGGSRIRQDGKNEQMSVEKSLDAGNRKCLLFFYEKRNNGLITLDGTCKFDKRLDSQSVRFSSQAEKL